MNTIWKTLTRCRVVAPGTRNASRALIARLLAIVFLVFAPTLASACGSYQTCTDVFILKFDAAPQHRAEGDPVHVAMHTFEFANWYYTVSTMTFPVVVWGTVASRTIVGDTVQTLNQGPYPYGYLYYVQNTEWDTTLDWNGLDANGQAVSDPTLLTINVNAGSAIVTRAVALFTVSGKDLGKPECPEANPCNPATGNKFQEEIDFFGAELIPGLTRNYNHMAGTDIGLGAGWTSGYHKRLRLDGDKLTVIRGDGKRERLSYLNGAWVPDADSRLKVIADANGYTLTLDTGEVESYDANGRLLGQTDLNGRQTTLGYDASGHLTQVTGPAGHTLTFGWTQNHITSLTLPSGVVIQYAYDANNNLATLIWPDAAVRTYHYENTDFPHALTGITDENGTRYATWTYDALGRVIASTHAGGADATTFAYAAGGAGLSQTTVTLPTGLQRDYAFTQLLGANRYTQVAEATGAAVTPTIQVTRDVNGNIASRTDYNGTVTTYAYDLARNLETSRTEAYGTPQARTITTAWHPSYRLPTQITEPGRTTTYSYDAAGNLQQKTLTANGQTRTWTYTYNTWGQLLTLDGPRTDVADITRYDYDTQGNLTQITDPLGHTTRITAHDPNGRPLTLIDPNGLTTTLTYDPRGRLLIRTTGSETTAYTYDAAGQLTRITQPDASYLVYTHDGAHRLTGIADGNGNRIAYTLDAAGNRTKEDVYDPNGVLARTRTQVYDSLSRLAQSIDSQSHATTYTYDANGNLTSTTDPNGAKTTNGYDSLNRLTQTLDPQNGATRTSYDPLDQITAITDPIGITTAYTPNALGDITAETSPDIGTTTNTHDSAGNLHTRSDATGLTLSYSYDALNRLTAIASNTIPLITYTWDSTAIGQLAHIQDPSGTTAYGYDPMGRITSKTQTLDTLTQTLHYTHAPGGQISQITTPGGNTIDYGYTQGKIASIAINGQTLLANASHAPFGPITGWTWANGSTHTRAYDADGNLQRIESATTTTYSYDLASRLTGQHHWSQSTPPQDDILAQYTLDNSGRLTGQTRTITGTATTSQSTAYSYDANGNRLQSSVDSATTGYSYSGNRLTGVTATTIPTQPSNLSNTGGSPCFNEATGSTTCTPTTTTTANTYDAAGRLLTDGLYGYSYDPLGRLAAVTAHGANVESYRYNALGQRVAKDGLNTERFIYDEEGHLLGEYDANGKMIQEIVWLEDLPVASVRPASTGSGTEVYYIHPDHLGTPRQITDSANRIVWRWDDVEPFGANAASEDPDGDGVSFVFNLRFPGQYYDSETGKHYNYFRDYDPKIGRYTTSDPLGLLGGQNRYSYVGARPLSWIDEFGLADQPPLRPMHSVSTIKSGSSNYSSWSKESTQTIVDSLKPGSAEPLKVGPDGKIWDGNTRTTILKERGVDINRLPRVPYTPRGIGSCVIPLQLFGIIVDYIVNERCEKNWECHCKSVPGGCA